MSDYTILLIDYDPRSIEHIRGLLEGAGHRVEVAKNGLAGLDAFRKLTPSLVLVEAMLPKKHGFEVCQEIKQSPEGRDVPVVIITAVYRGRKYRSQAFHLYKCDEYLEKPISDDKLKQAIEGLLGRGSGAEQPAARPAAAAAPTPAPTAPQADSTENRPSPDAPTPSSAPKPAEADRVAAPAKVPTPPSPPKPTGAAGPGRGAAPAIPAASGKRPDRAPDPAPARAEAKPPASPEPADADESIAEFTEEDIMSTLDSIMPDDNAAKTASR